MSVDWMRQVQERAIAYATDRLVTDAALSAGADIRALHESRDGGFTCAHCIAQEYPCPTRRILDERGCP